MSTVAALLASCAELVATYPIDALKVRHQAGHTLRNPTTWMYRGIATRAVGLLPMRTTFWSSMAYAENKITRVPLLAGGIAGCAQSLIDVPVECMKIRAMTARAPLLSRPLKAKDFVRGWHYTTLRNIGFAACVCQGRSQDAAAVGAAFGVLITHPLDTLKTRAQAFDSTPPKGVWRGLFPRMAMCSVAMFIGSSAFNLLERMM